MISFNPFVPNAPFLYLLKTSENHKVFCFQGVDKGCIGNEWVTRALEKSEYVIRIIPLGSLIQSQIIHTKNKKQTSRMPSTDIIDSYQNFEYVLKIDNMYENL